MNKLIIHTLVALFATAAFAVAAEKDDAIAREKAAWQAFKDKKADDFRKVFGANYRGIYAEGVSKMDDELKSMQTADMKSVTHSDFDVAMVSATTYLITYKVTMQGTQGSADMSGTYNCASVWQKEGNDWKALFHTNVKEEKMATTSPTGS